MINQVVPNNVQNRTFSDFSQPENGWYLRAPIQNTDEKNKKHYGKTIVIGTMFVGFGILALMKGAVPKTMTKYLEKLKFKLEEKTMKGGRLQSFYRKMADGVTSFLKKTESVNNFTSLKDVLFQKFMFGKDGKSKFTKKIHQGITAFFNKLSRNTVNTSYAKTHKKFANLNEYFTNLNEQILMQNPNAASDIERINQRIVRVNEALNKGFGINARNSRLAEMEKATDGLYDYFWNASFGDVRNFKSKNMWQSFIAEDFMIPFKMKISNEVGILRQAITHDIIDNYKATMKAIDNINKFVNPADSATNDVLYQLRKNLDKYKKLSGDNELVERAALNSEIMLNLRQLSDTFQQNASKYNYSGDAVSSISKYTKEVESIISKNSKGELQEILTAYKKLLPRKEYLKLRSQVNQAIKSLDNSIDTETVKYVDKARDLKLGSAPTDILSILGAIGTVGWYLGKSKDNDERISASLRYGIPAIGAIATSLYSTAKLVSGGKSLALGLLSGWVMNIIGSQIDYLRKQYSVDISLQNKRIVKPQSDIVSTK